MTGLEKIIKHIEEDASAVAEEKIGEAKYKADQLILAAREEGDKESRNMEEKSRLDVSMCLSRGKSAALLQKRKLILSAKQQMIDEILQKAKASLFELENEEYFNTILKMLIKYVQQMPGEIVFSETDKERMPKNFSEQITSVLAEVPGASLKISDQVRTIDGGFVLIYEGVEENCSIEALLSANREVLQDKIGGLLFG